MLPGLSYCIDLHFRAQSTHRLVCPAAPFQFPSTESLWLADLPCPLRKESKSAIRFPGRKIFENILLYSLKSFFTLIRDLSCLFLSKTAFKNNLIISLWDMETREISDFLFLVFCMKKCLGDVFFQQDLEWKSFFVANIMSVVSRENVKRFTMKFGL